MQQLHSIALRVASLVVVLMIIWTEAAAWSINQSAFGSRRKHPSIASNPSKPVAAPQSLDLISQKMLKNPGNPRVINQSPRKTNVKLSNSVLASCDILPSFPTAHGLLSPETVMRLEEMNRGTHNNEALVNFLSTYRKSGPLSCVPMLSDPDVLPHLTRAMRDITL